MDKGHEIGLHGKTHDRALGFRSKTYIREFVESAKRELERRIGRIHGFRAPALAVSDDVIAILGDLGFKYDSSLTNCSLCGNFTSNCGPFKIGEAGLVEMPLTVQDSMFTNDIPSSVDPGRTTYPAPGGTDRGEIRHVGCEFSSGHHQFES